MTCTSCQRENPPRTRYCKYCGRPLQVSMRTCPNGHNYDAGLPACPYCPDRDFGSGPSRTDERRVGTDRGPTKPWWEGERSYHGQADQRGGTIAEGLRTDRTIIYDPVKDLESSIHAEPRTGRKLVAWLVTYELEQTGTEYRVYEGRTRIGRVNTNDIVISHPGVSEFHATLLYRDKSLILKDELSTNGTCVNGKPIADAVVLKDNDEVRFGDVKFKLKVI